jgi:HAMP domain-containing protein
MEVINIGDLNAKKRRENLLEVLEDFRQRVESGEIEEFVTVSIDTDGTVKVHACVLDAIGGVGLMEIGKNILISQSQQ